MIARYQREIEKVGERLVQRDTDYLALATPPPRPGISNRIGVVSIASGKRGDFFRSAIHKSRDLENSTLENTFSS